MSSHNQIIPAISCAESIALLSLLHRVPESPSASSLLSLPVHTSTYTLPFHEERLLASTLAFLSHTDDDCDHIPAVCVQENPQKSVLDILLAVNSVKHNDGAQVLYRMKTGFEGIFANISHLSLNAVDDHDEANLVERILTAVVKMCSHRILYRLRLHSHSRKIAKRPLQETLQEAIIAVEQVKIRKATDKRLQFIATKFMQKAKEVVALANAWKRHQTLPGVQALVEGIARLHKVRNYEVLFSIMPNQDMNPDSRKSLCNMIAKVSRYRAAAKLLLRMAKRFPVMRKVNIIAVRLPEQAFRKPSTDEYQPLLASTLERVMLFQPKRKKCSLPRLAQLLNTSEAELMGTFARTTRNTLECAKIHAEIQLLIHCELHSSLPPPRVISSSKDACYLCNAFIRMHGKIHTPRTHGRLYPTWRLPNLPGFIDMERRFHDVLKTKVQDSIGKLVLPNQRRILHPYPNESTLLTLPGSLATLQSLAVSQANSEAVQPDVGSTSPTGDTSLTLQPRNAATVMLVSPSSVAVLASTYNSRHRNTSPIHITTSIDNTTYDETILDPVGQQGVSNSTHSSADSGGSSDSSQHDAVSNTNRISIASAISSSTHAPPSLSIVHSSIASPIEQTYRTSSPSHHPLVLEHNKIDANAQPKPEDQWIRLDNLELFIENKSRATANLSMIPCLLDRVPKAVTVVDIDRLTPGDDLTVRTSVGQDEKVRVYLDTADALGSRQQWEVAWTMNI